MFSRSLNFPWQFIIWGVGVKEVVKGIGRRVGRKKGVVGGREERLEGRDRSGLGGIGEESGFNGK